MNPLAHIRRFRHKGLVALFALVALMFATTAYVAHGLSHDKPLSTHSSAQCDLCLQFAARPARPNNRLERANRRWRPLRPSNSRLSDSALTSTPPIAFPGRLPP